VNRTHSLTAITVDQQHDLPPCSQRYTWDASRHVYFCAHPQVHAPGSLVQAPQCRSCDYSRQPLQISSRPFAGTPAADRAPPCYWLGKQVGETECASCQGRVRLKLFACGHPQHELATLRDCAACGDFEERLVKGKVRRFADGLVATPIIAPHTERTVADLLCSGFLEDELHVFTGSEDAGAYAPNMAVSRRAKRLGSWTNWFSALTELYLAHPGADALVMVAGNCRFEFPAHFRRRLQQELWPAEQVGLLLPAAKLPASPPSDGFYPLPPAALSSLSGSADVVVMPPVAVRSLLRFGATHVQHLRGHAAEPAVAAVLAQWCQHHRPLMPALAHWPPLVCHAQSESFISQGTEPNKALPPIQGDFR
jgi:hypothetical protein